MSHLHDKIDFTVEVFIVFKDKVLLRRHDKYKIWLSVGGHIELDEDPIQAATREVKEEVGLDITIFDEDNFPIKITENFRPVIRPQFVNRHRINDKHEHITFIYFATADNDQLTLCQKEKSDGCRWFTLEELNDPEFAVTDNVKYYAQTALNKIGK